MSTLAATHFNYTNTGPLLQDIVNQVAPEVPYQTSRFGAPTTEVQWRTTIEAIDEYLRTEPYVVAGVWEKITVEPMNVVISSKDVS